MDSAAKINTLKQGLRFKYATNVTGLRALWEKVFSESTEFVEITGTSFEGGSASGVQVLDRLEYLAAVQSVLLELAPDTTPAPPPGNAYANYACGPLQF
jgi:hypothetical protein